MTSLSERENNQLTALQLTTAIWWVCLAPAVKIFKYRPYLGSISVELVVGNIFQLLLIGKTIIHLDLKEHVISHANTHDFHRLLKGLTAF